MDETTELTQRWISVKEHSAFPSTSKLERAVQYTRAVQSLVPLIFSGAAIREIRSLIRRNKKTIHYMLMAQNPIEFHCEKNEKQNSFQLNIIAINPINTSRTQMP